MRPCCGPGAWCGPPARTCPRTTWGSGPGSRRGGAAAARCRGSWPTSRYLLGRTSHSVIVKSLRTFVLSSMHYAGSHHSITSLQNLVTCTQDWLLDTILFRKLKLQWESWEELFRPEGATWKLIPHHWPMELAFYRFYTQFQIRPLPMLPTQSPTAHPVVVRDIPCSMLTM